MNTLDIIILIPLLWGLWQGFRQGLILAGGSLVALLVGIWGAIHFSEYTAGLLAEKFGLTSEYNSLIAFAVTFIVLVVGINVLAFLMNKFFEAIALGFVIKLLGALFGLIKWLFVVSAVLSILNAWNINHNIISAKTIEDSRLYTPVSKVAPAIYPYLKFENITSVIPQLNK